MPAKLDDRLAFERALLDTPEDLATWAVYADHLQQLGDPWGERVSLGLARGEASGNRFMQFHDAVVEFDQLMAAAMLGERLAGLLERPGFAATVKLERRFGVIFGARVGRVWAVRGDSPENQADREYADQVLDALLTGPAARLLSSLVLGYCDLRQACTRLAGSGSAANLRRLSLGWEVRQADGLVASLPDLGKLDALLDRLPSLRELSLAGGTRRFEHSRVERLSLTIDVAETTLLDALASAELPRLRTLELVCAATSRARDGSIGSGRVAEQFAALQAWPSFAGLEQLELVGWKVGSSSRSEALLTHVVRTLPGSRVRRLVLVLDEFDRGNAAADLLLGEASSLDALEQLDVEILDLDERMAEQLRQRFGERLRLKYTVREDWEPEG
jgi:uncharacterized protein (TIGR02996 family)